MSEEMRRHAYSAGELGAAVEYRELLYQVSAKAAIVKPGQDPSMLRGKISRLWLDTLVRHFTNLSQYVDCQVASSEKQGISVIMHSRNIFRPRHVGFYVHPGSIGDLPDYEVFYGRSKKFKDEEVPIGYDLFEDEQYEPAVYLIKRSFARSFSLRASSFLGGMAVRHRRTGQIE